MIIICAGMQKSGSGYFYSIINALLVEAGNSDARATKAKYGLDKIMRWHNNNIGRPSFYKLFKLYRVSKKEGDFVVKTHFGPNIATKICYRLGIIKIVYSFRDPRDVLLSAADHGKKIIESGQKHRFSKMIDFDKAMKIVKSWLRIWEKYKKMHGVMTVKYEEMMENPIETTRTIEQYLNISVDDKKREGILWHFSKDNTGGDKQGMHFNKAIINRYKSEMTQSQKQRVLKEFRTYIEGMSYDFN